jgi:hypothetical protein
LDDPAGQAVRASDVQRSFASATLRGDAADARHVLTRLRRPRDDAALNLAGGGEGVVDGAVAAQVAVQQIA